MDQSQLARQHRRELSLVTGVVARRVSALARIADPDDIDAWYARHRSALLRTVTQGHSAAAVLGGRYVRRSAAIEGLTITPVRADVDSRRVATSTEVTGPVAFKLHMSATGDDIGARATMNRTLTGAAERHAIAGARDTVLATGRSDSEMVGWQRVTSASPCPFCAELAAVDLWDTEADFQAHDHCKCTVRPVWR